MNLVVAFEEDDVVFFDGENISVKRLTILDSDKYRLEEVNNQNLIEFFKGSWRFASVFLIDEVKQY